MSLYINFDPHSHYMGWAIKDNRATEPDNGNLERPLDTLSAYNWSAYTDDGNTYRIIERHADTLAELKRLIKEYNESHN